MKLIVNHLVYKIFFFTKLTAHTITQAGIKSGIKNKDCSTVHEFCTLFYAFFLSQDYLFSVSNVQRIPATFILIKAATKWRIPIALFQLFCAPLLVDLAK